MMSLAQIGFEVSTEPLLISFDIFDTLLLRRVETPEQVFELVGKRAVDAGLVDGGLSPILFRLTRQEAERRARARVPGGEVELAAIHAEAALGDPAALAALELAVEAEQLFANPLLLPLLVDLAQRGVPVVLLSDMYLAPGDLVRLLTAAGIGPELYRALYVSNAYGCSKHDGGLFRRLLADYPGVPPDRILHIGDAPHGDVSMATAAGLRTLHYVPRPRWRRMIERERCVAGPSSDWPPSGLYLRRLAALASRNDAADSAFLLDFGSLILGPAVAEYCRWVVEECHRHGIRRIAPLMREAALFVPLMRDWIAHRGYDIAVTSLYVSRQALLPLELKKLDGSQARSILTARPHLPWDRLLVLAGGAVPPDLAVLTGLALEHLTGRTLPDGGSALDRILALFGEPSLVAAALRQANKTQSLLLDHLEEALGRDEPVALVDLGARGSTPAALVRLLPNGRDRCRIFLAYGVSDIAPLLADGIRLQVFAGQDQLGITLGRVLYRSPQVLERALTGLDGTTLGYERDERGHCRPITAAAPAKGEEKRQIGLMQEGIRRYAALMPLRPVDGDIPLPTGAQAFIPLAATLLQPTGEEARILGDLAYDQNDGTEGERRICDPAALETVRPLVELREGPLLGLALGLRPSLAPWPQGALTRLDDGIFRRPADLLQMETGHGSFCRALVGRLQALDACRFVVLAVGGEGGMGPDFIGCARDAGLEPLGYADLMPHLVPPPRFHGVPVHDLDDLPLPDAAEGTPVALVLVTLGYADRLADLVRARYGAQGHRFRLVALVRPDLETG